MKKTNPTKPIVNSDGNDVYTINTIGDLTVLYHHLPPEKRALLLKDLENGLSKTSAKLDTLNPLMAGIIKAGVRVSALRWIDDDKGRVTVTLRAREDGDPLFTTEL
jgi:hypothetical protein